MENEGSSNQTKPIKFSDFKLYSDNSGNTARKLFQSLTIQRSYKNKIVWVWKAHPMR